MGFQRDRPVGGRWRRGPRQPWLPRWWGPAGSWAPPRSFTSRRTWPPPRRPSTWCSSRWTSWVRGGAGSRGRGLSGVGAGLRGRRLTARAWWDGEEACSTRGGRHLEASPLAAPSPGEGRRALRRVTGLSEPGGLDYLVLNHIGGAPAGTRFGSAQATRWLTQVHYSVRGLGVAPFCPGPSFSQPKAPPQALPLLTSRNRVLPAWLHPQVLLSPLPRPVPAFLESTGALPSSPAPCPYRPRPPGLDSALLGAPPPRCSAPPLRGPGPAPQLWLRSSVAASLPAGRLPELRAADLAGAAQSDGQSGLLGGGVFVARCVRGAAWGGGRPGRIPRGGGGRGGSAPGLPQAACPRPSPRPTRPPSPR